jgi:hypothetical protein
VVRRSRRFEEDLRTTRSSFWIVASYSQTHGFDCDGATGQLPARCALSQSQPRVQLLVRLGCRFQYEDEVQRNPHGYDAWFDYIKLEEEAAAGNVDAGPDRVREVGCGIG